MSALYVYVVALCMRYPRSDSDIRILPHVCHGRRARGGTPKYWSGAVTHCLQEHPSACARRRGRPLHPSHGSVSRHVNTGGCRGDGYHRWRRGMSSCTTPGFTDGSGGKSLIQNTVDSIRDVFAPSFVSMYPRQADTSSPLMHVIMKTALPDDAESFIRAVCYI